MIKYVVAIMVTIFLATLYIVISDDILRKQIIRDAKQVELDNIRIPFVLRSK